MLNVISLLAALIFAIVAFASMDSWCAAMLEQESPIPGMSDTEYYTTYVKGTDALKLGCEFCKAIPAMCPDGAAGACVLCVDGLLSLYATMAIVGALVIELPSAILATVVSVGKESACKFLRAKRRNPPVKRRGAAFSSLDLTVFREAAD